jgi:(2Fe-2S) ferredoxin
VGEPDLVFYQDLTGPMVILAWYTPVERDRVRTLLYQMAAGDAVEKSFAGGFLIEETSVHGHPARWGSSSHVLTLYDEGGGGNLNSERYVPGSVLQWEEDGVAYRLETPADLSEAVKIAESVR